MLNVNNIQSLSHQISSFDPKAFFSGDNKKYALIAAVALAMVSVFAALYYLFKKYYPQKINASPTVSQNNIKASPSGLQNHVSAPPSIVKNSELADLFNDWEQAITKQTPTKVSEITSALQKKIDDASDDTLDVDSELDVLSKISALATQANNTDLRDALDALVQRWFDENSKKGAGVGARFSTIVEKLQPFTLKSELTVADIDIIKQAKSLKSIVCGVWVDDERLGNLVQSCPWIERLFLTRSRITDAGLAHLKKLNALKELDLHFMAQITDQSLAHVQGLTSLQILNLEMCDRVTNHGLAHLQGLTALLKLNLKECDIGDQGLSYLKGMTNLQELNVEHCRLIGDNGLAHLRGLIFLQVLNLRGPNAITDHGLKYLRGMTSLRELRLFLNTMVTDNGLVHLRGLTALRSLELDCLMKISGRGLAQLQGLTGLEYLNLSSCSRITDDDLVYLKGLTALKKLKVVNCQGLTVKGKKHLKGLKDLIIKGI